jgi:hypothetical protein
VRAIASSKSSDDSARWYDCSCMLIIAASWSGVRESPDAFTVSSGKLVRGDSQLRREEQARHASGPS